MDYEATRETGGYFGISLKCRGVPHHPHILEFVAGKLKRKDDLFFKR